MNIIDKTKVEIVLNKDENKPINSEAKLSATNSDLTNKPEKKGFFSRLKERFSKLYNDQIPGPISDADTIKTNKKDYEDNSKLQEILDDRSSSQRFNKEIVQRNKKRVNDSLKDTQSTSQKNNSNETYQIGGHGVQSENLDEIIDEYEEVQNQNKQTLDSKEFFEKDPDVIPSLEVKNDNVSSMETDNFDIEPNSSSDNLSSVSDQNADPISSISFEPEDDYSDLLDNLEPETTEPVKLNPDQNLVKQSLKHDLIDDNVEKIQETVFEPETNDDFLTSDQLLSDTTVIDQEPTIEIQNALVSSNEPNKSDDHVLKNQKEIDLSHKKDATNEEMQLKADLLKLEQEIKKIKLELQAAESQTNSKPKEKKLFDDLENITDSSLNPDDQKGNLDFIQDSVTQNLLDGDQLLENFDVQKLEAQENQEIDHKNRLYDQENDFNLVQTLKLNQNKGPVEPKEPAINSNLKAHSNLKTVQNTNTKLLIKIKKRLNVT
ncbi:hypothetical protein MCAV_04810 [[Mycoplasma] cavipharyngis]|uniref:hypothetical protein n=1 Tax=[Mycoplasma] cavipharyngis TaxID=92757 RepID=UPI003703F188